MIKDYKQINEKLFSFKTESGLPVFVLPKKGFGKSFATFAANFGSIDNAYTADGKKTILPNGTAHFLEHKMFEEPDKNIFAEFSKYGASANAYTSFDMTGYLFSATRNFYDCLEILLGYVQHPYFTDENVEKERGIIGQEIGMYNDDPNWNVFFNMLRGMYKNHSINIDIAGSTKSIAQINKEMLFDIHKNFYAPKNMVLYVAGDVDPDRVYAMADDNVKKCEPADVKTIISDEPYDVVKSDITASFSIAKPMFSLGFKEKPSNMPIHADVKYGILLDMMFGRSSSIYKELYDEGLINDSFSAGYEAGKGYAFCEISGESDNPEKVRDCILEYIRKTKAQGLDKQSFKRSKSAFYGDVMRMLNDVEDITSESVAAFLRGGDYLDMAQVISDIEFEQVEKLLQNALYDDKNTLSTVYPF